MARSRSLIPAVVVLVLAAAAPAAAAPARVDGDGLDILIDEQGRIQAIFDGETTGQFAPGTAESADAGVNVAVYPPNGAPAVFGFLGQPLTPVTLPHTVPEAPHVASAEWTAGGLLNVSVTGTSGSHGFVLAYDFQNISDQPLHIRPSVAGDLNVGGSDRGTPFLETVSVEGFRFRFVGGHNGLLRGGFQDVSGDLFDAYEAGPVEAIFAKVRDPLGPGFTDEVATEASDNGVGVQANDHQPGGAPLAPGESATLATSMVFDRSVPTAERIEDLPAPEPFREVNVEEGRGQVFVKLPAGTSTASLRARTSQAGAPKGYVALEQAAQLPVGTIVKADRGALKLAAAQRATKGGALAQATFYSGTFQIVQERARRPVTEMVLKGGTYRGCPTTRGKGSRADADTSQRRRRTSRSRVRRLWGNGKGRFRTRGRYSSATVRGTKWLVEDRCGGTLTRLPRSPRTSRVDVRDFTRRKTIRLRAGRSYLARPRTATARR